MVRRVFAAWLAIVLMAAVAVVVGAGAPASADECEVTELIVRNVDPKYEEPGSEPSKPQCVLLNDVVYPQLCQNSSTLARCLQEVQDGDQGGGGGG